MYQKEVIEIDRIFKFKLLNISTRSKGSFILERKQMRKQSFSLMFAATAVAVV